MEDDLSPTTNRKLEKLLSQKYKQVCEKCKNIVNEIVEIELELESRYNY